MALPLTFDSPDRWSRPSTREVLTDSLARLDAEFAAVPEALALTRAIREAGDELHRLANEIDAEMFRPRPAVALSALKARARTGAVFAVLHDAILRASRTRAPDQEAAL